MAKEKSFIVGFSDSETKKINSYLNRLLLYLSPNNFVIVEGLAIRYHLISHGIDYPKRPFNDLDIIIKSLDDISRRVSGDFLIGHYHPKDSYLALVDPISKN